MPTTKVVELSAPHFVFQVVPWQAAAAAHEFMDNDGGHQPTAPAAPRLAR